MAPQPEFRVLDTENVLITSPTPDGDGEGDGAPTVACAVPLTFFDVKWLHLPPVERVLLYRLPDDADADAILSNLKASLSHALRAFYPLAGRVRLAAPAVGRTTDVVVRHELFYQPGDGVQFTTAEYDADVDDLASDEVRVAAVAPLAPPLPEGNAVLAVQVTILRRGVAVGVTIHHSACDGRSSTHFLHTWASAAAACAAAADGGGDKRLPAAKVIDDDPPVIDVDRTLVPDPRGLYDTYLNCMPPIARSPELEFVRSKQPPAADVAVATFTLSAEALQSVRSAVAREAARRGHALSPRCSPLVAAYGLMWWCHCHAVKRSSSNSSSKYYFLFSVDQRARFKPAPLPDRYFGNCMCPAIATAARDEMIAGEDDVAGGLYAACAAVAAAIEEEVGEGAQEERWDGCVARVKHAVANGTLSVAGSPRFRVYHLDFGFGRPIKVHMVSVAKAGAISVADARAGGRGLELGVSLPPDAMDRLRSCFAKAMDACLRQ
ncbi:hypothetical protein EJB05_33378, partial [Eragrostis curvula]